MLSWRPVDRVKAVKAKHCIQSVPVMSQLHDAIKIQLLLLLL